MAEKKYIECEALIDTMQAALDALPKGAFNPNKIGFAAAIEGVKNFPAADVRPVVRGKWRPYSPLTDTYECDKCGYQVIDESFRTNYCPNCGADMKEE